VLKNITTYLWILLVPPINYLTQMKRVFQNL
jgi:hypothetical protein